MNPYLSYRLYQIERVETRDGVIEANARLAEIGARPSRPRRDLARLARLRGLRSSRSPGPGQPGPGERQAIQQPS
jgi:hypothetical protein